MFIMVYHWVISCTRQIPYFPQNSFHITVQLCLCLLRGHCQSGFPTKIPTKLLTFPMQHYSNIILYFISNNMQWKIWLLMLLFMQFSSVSCFSLSFVHTLIGCVLNAHKVQKVKL
jgi:hypothetical protein